MCKNALLSFLRQSNISAAMIKGRMQADINLFMIYYVFPAILLTGDEEADRLCTGMKEAWNARFSDTNISYTTYDKLYDSFNEKIFGMF